ncbi:MAG TPA: hypothetical protein VJB13_03270 [Candidatus Nanoarchaeia archaeon]|nr:hypothetical protein [Candidatus Nanoarchaeia archaeon]
MKTKNAKSIWNMIGLFLVVLVLSMPVYSASALAASVQITKNEGEAAVPKYLDAQGDVWTVEALISGAGTSNASVKPEDVKIKIGDNQAPFTSCSPSTLGVLCKYISPLTDGIQQGEYTFQVIYSFLNAAQKQESVSAGDVIKADGSAPQIFFSPGKVSQDENGKVKIDFTVNDKKEGFPSVGLKKIDIIDSDTADVLQTINLPEGKETFSYLSDGGFEGFLQSQQLSGDGTKKIKIRAEDNLGHVSFSSSVSFFADFVKPKIGNQLNFTKFGKFIGEFASSTDIVVDVVEKSVPKVIGQSPQADLDGKTASCEADADIDDLWHCTWKDVNVNPASSITVLVKAIDAKGNVAEKSLSSTFVVDNSAPVIKFFGTIKQFEGKSYLKNNENKIILRAEDQGAGVSKDGIRANLVSFGLSNLAEPTACQETAGVLECYWNIDEKINEGVVTFGLSRFEDNVGNEGSAPESQLIVDNTGPKVESIEVFGVSEVGDKNYFQSNDKLKIVLRTSESSGLRVLVNVQDLLLDAENKYPANDFIDEDGWVIFTDEDCKRVEGHWQCTLETDTIKSGPESAVEVPIRVQDTAGNDAVSWPLSENEPKNAKKFKSSKEQASISLDLLGLSTEENPDFWEVRKVVPAGGANAFIDLDTTQLTYTRLPFKVALSADLSDVKALDIQLVNCAVPSPESKKAADKTAAKETNSNAPKISRAILYGGVSASGDYAPTPNVIVEFEPFDGRSLFQIGQKEESQFVKQEVEYVCTLKIFSQVGKNAIRAAEVQQVKVVVPFAFSALGSQDENLEQVIKDARDDINTAWDIIGVLANILRYVDYLIQVYHIIVGIYNIFEGVSSGPIEAMYHFQYTKVAGVTICTGMTLSQKSVDSSVSKFLDPILQVLTCRPGVSPTNWYGKWQSTILELYKVELLKAPGDPLGKNEAFPARDIRDNLFLSIAGICIPGIIKNLDKLRQIKCRKIVCLENEVRSGLATVSMCEELEDMLVCKYVVGELWYIIPFSQFWDNVIGGLAKALADPIAIVHTATILSCLVTCNASSAGKSACSYAYFIWDLVGVLENVAGFLTTVIADFKNGGLNYCDAVGGTFGVV